MTMTPGELKAWGEAYVASLEDGSQRAKIEARVIAELGPEWNAEYGEAAWETAQIVSGDWPASGKPSVK
ncbi:MAG TPA: hypothetical protein VIK31_11830 [Propionibacteriaceae bacterium]